ncbi:hypothetical protein BXY51_009227 [Actinoplanes cyaneus]|nr:hypothetical protein [Actinoplanes cyaneus]
MRRYAPNDVFHGPNGPVMLKYDPTATRSFLMDASIDVGHPAGPASAAGRVAAALAGIVPVDWRVAIRGGGWTLVHGSGAAILTVSQPHAADQDVARVDVPDHSEGGMDLQILVYAPIIDDKMWKLARTLVAWDVVDDEPKGV